MLPFFIHQFLVIGLPDEAFIELSSIANELVPNSSVGQASSIDKRNN